MSDDIGSTVPRRRLGRLLRRFRTEAGVTLDAAAEALEYSRQKIWRIESGLGSVRVLDVKAMCELYGVPPQMTDMMRRLAVETRAKGWWHTYGDVVPSWFELYLGLESAAARLRRYDESLIPDLFQTRQYALGLHPSGSPHSAEQHKRAVELRMRRQGLLTRPAPAPPHVEQVLSEAALRRPVGGPTVISGQLARLLEVSELPHVSLRVLPLAAGPHPGAAAGSFVILDFPATGDGQGGAEPPVVYLETLTGALYLDRPDELAAYDTSWRGVDALALDEPESRDVIKRVLDETRHE